MDQIVRIAYVVGGGLVIALVALLLGNLFGFIDVPTDVLADLTEAADDAMSAVPSDFNPTSTDNALMGLVGAIVATLVGVAYKNR